MMVEVEKDGIIGYGEASMPPYLGESQESASRFSLARWIWQSPRSVSSSKTSLLTIDAIAPGNNPAAKAAVDIALHDWIGKKMGQPWYRIWGLNPAKTPV